MSNASFDDVFLDRPKPRQPFNGLFAATVAGNADTGQADVTLDGFDSNSAASYTATFEPRFGSSGSPQTPPVGTKCLVAFTTPIAYPKSTATAPAPANVGIGATPWIVAFSGWPS